MSQSLQAAVSEVSAGPWKLHSQSWTKLAYDDNFHAASCIYIRLEGSSVPRKVKTTCLLYVQPQFLSFLFFQVSIIFPGNQRGGGQDPRDPHPKSATDIYGSLGV